jgi:hypothetical protein
MDAYQRRMHVHPELRLLRLDALAKRMEARWRALMARGASTIAKLVGRDEFEAEHEADQVARQA